MIYAICEIVKVNRNFVLHILSRHKPILGIKNCGKIVSKKLFHEIKRAIMNYGFDFYSYK